MSHTALLLGELGRLAAEVGPGVASAPGTGFRWLSADYWDLSIPVYLYFAALAGGAYLAGSSAWLLRSRRPDSGGPEGEIARWGFMIAVASTAVAGLAVLSHLAVVYRAILFPIYLTNFNSWITVGTWILVLLAVFSVLSLVFRLFGEHAAEESGASAWPRAVVARLRILGPIDRLVDRLRLPRVPAGVGYGVGSLLALATMYTGFELAIVETVPIWNRPVLMPVLFLTSGVAAGVGLTLAVTMLFQRELTPTVGGYATVVGVLSGASLALAGYGWRQIATSDAPAAAASYVQLTSGTLAVGVWVVAGGFLLATVAGLAIGLAAATDRLSESTERVGGPALIASFALLAVGGLLLRVLLLLAAEENPVVVVL